MASDFDTTWESLVSLYADRGWAIAHSDRGAGLLKSAPMQINLEEGYADCGSAGAVAVNGTLVVFDSFVKRAGRDESELVVNATYKQARSFDNGSWVVDCNSTGKLEREIHLAVDRRVVDGSMRKAKEQQRQQVALTFFCTAAPADPNVAACARSEAGCAKKQSAIIDAAGDATKCAPRPHAVCFTAKNASGVTVENCFPSIEACQPRQQATATDASFTDTTSCIQAK